MQAAGRTAHKELADKLLDIADIYTAYNLAIERHSADADDNLAMIVNRLADADVLQGHLFLWHFRSFTPTEYEALSGLMRRLDVTAILCTDTLKEQTSIFAPVVHTWEELCRAAAEAGAPVETPVTTPLALTVAMLLSRLVKVRDWDAVEGATEPVILPDAPGLSTR